MLRVLRAHKAEIMGLVLLALLEQTASHVHSFPLPIVRNCVILHKSQDVLRKSVVPALWLHFSEIDQKHAKQQETAKTTRVRLAQAPNFERAFKHQSKIPKLGEAVNHLPHLCQLPNSVLFVDGDVELDPSFSLDELYQWHLRLSDVLHLAVFLRPLYYRRVYRLIHLPLIRALDQHRHIDIPVRKVQASGKRPESFHRALARRILDELAQTE